MARRTAGDVHRQGHKDELIHRTFNAVGSFAKCSSGMGGQSTEYVVQVTGPMIDGPATCLLCILRLEEDE